MVISYKYNSNFALLRSFQRPICTSMPHPLNLRRIFFRRSGNHHKTEEDVRPRNNPTAAAQSANPPARESAYPTPYQLEQSKKPPERGILCQSCNKFLHWLQAPDRAKENVWDGRYRHYQSAQIWQTGLKEGCSLCTFLESFWTPIIKEILSERRRPLLVWFADAGGGVEGSESMHANLTTEDEPFHGRKGLTFRFIPVPPEQGKTLSVAKGIQFLTLHEWILADTRQAILSALQSGFQLPDSGSTAAQETTQSVKELELMAERDGSRLV